MSPPEPATNGSPERLRIAASNLAALRGVRGANPVFAGLYRSCRAWLRERAPELSEAVVESLVVEALSNRLDELRDPSIGAAEVSAALEVALDLALAWRLAAEQASAATDGDSATGVDAERAELELRAIHLLEVARAIRRLVPIALRLMPVAERAVLARKVGLPVAAGEEDDSSPASRPPSLMEALQVFLPLLGGVLEAAGMALEIEPGLLVEAIELIETRTVLETLILFADLEGKA